MLACGNLGEVLDGVVALEVVLPDSGRVEVTDTLRPRGRALNGRGAAVLAQLYWASLDTAIIAVPDSTTAAVYAKAVGTGRLQARAGALRSNPLTVTVLAPLDSITADGTTRDTVKTSGATPDSLSDSLRIRAFAGTGSLAGRRVAYAAAIYPSAGGAVRLVPGDTVQTNALGRAAAQLRLLAGVLPESAVVTATVRRLDGGLVLGSPVRFVVEFRP